MAGRGGRAPNSSIMLAIAALLAAGGKVTAFLRNVVLSYFFGAGPATEAYFIANVIPGLIWLAIFATIAAVFLPLYQQRRLVSVASAARLAQEATQIYGFAALGLTLICIFLAGPIVRLTAPDASPATLVLAQQLTIIMATGFLFTGYVGLQNAIQQANGRFLSPLVAPVANNLITIGAMALAARVGSIHLVAFGAVFGWAVQAPFQRLSTLRYHPPRWRWQVRPETVRRLSTLSAPVMVGVFLDQVNIYVGIAVAGRLAPGAIAHLNYAGRLATFLATVFSWLVAYFLFPRLAALAARGEDVATGRTLSIGLFLIAAMTAPVLVVAMMMSEVFIAFVFGRGAFTPADVTATAVVFHLYAWSVLFIAVREMMNRVFFSYQKTGAPLIIGAVALVVNWVAAVFLGGVMGVAGVALAASLSALAYAVLQVGAIARWKPALLQTDLVKLIGAVAMATLACLLTAVMVVGPVASLPGIVQLTLVGLVSGTVYLMVLVPILAMMGYRISDLAGLLSRHHLSVK